MKNLIVIYRYHKILIYHLIEEDPFLILELSRIIKLFKNKVKVKKTIILIMHIINI